MCMYREENTVINSLHFLDYKHPPCARRLFSSGKHAATTIIDKRV